MEKKFYSIVLTLAYGTHYTCPRIYASIEDAERAAHIIMRNMTLKPLEFHIWPLIYISHPK